MGGREKGTGTETGHPGILAPGAAKFHVSQVPFLQGSWHQAPPRSLNVRSPQAPSPQAKSPSPFVLEVQNSDGLDQATERGFHVPTAYHCSTEQVESRLHM